MMTPYQTTRMEAVAVKPCAGCRTELLAGDKFCRWCGLRQKDTQVTRLDLAYFSECETKRLARERTNRLWDSGQLVHVVTESLSARTAIRQPVRGSQRLVCTLMTIPIWMLIVLLSPLDAYAASQAVARWWAASKGGTQEQELQGKKVGDVEDY